MIRVLKKRENNLKSLRSSKKSSTREKSCGEKEVILLRFQNGETLSPKGNYVPQRMTPPNPNILKHLFGRWNLKIPPCKALPAQGAKVTPSLMRK